MPNEAYWKKVRELALAVEILNHTPSIVSAEKIAKVARLTQELAELQKGL